MEPTYCDIPCANAGFIVYFAIYLLTLLLSFSSESPSNIPLCLFILLAVCHVLVITSPILPIAIASELIILNTPISCNISSAAIVWCLILESANAISSGTLGSKWWHTINISKCSAIVFIVKGLVGLVDAGITLSLEATFNKSGAWPPPAPSVWYVWIVLPAIASIVCSTNPPSFNVSVCTATWTSYLSAVFNE